MLEITLNEEIVFKIINWYIKNNKTEQMFLLLGENLIRSEDK